MNERGSGVIGFILLIGIALFPMMGLLAITAWPERINAANAAAYEAAKTVVEAPDPAAAMALGEQRAKEVVANHGSDASSVTVAFSPSDPHRGDEVTATVTVTLPALQFPGLGTWNSVQWSKTSVQVVGPFRGFE